MPCLAEIVVIVVVGSSACCCCRVWDPSGKGWAEFGGAE